jgi:mono/diheme cytochrome c family protein
LSAVVAGCGHGSGTTASSSGQPTPQFLYNAYCSACHGVDGRGVSGDDLVTPDLTRAAIDTRVRTGRGRMPGFAGRLPDDQIGEVVGYVVDLRAKAGKPTG